MLPKSKNRDICKLCEIIKVIIHWKQKQIFKLWARKQTNKSEQNKFNRAKD